MLRNSTLSCFAAALLFLYIIFQMTVFNAVSGHLMTDLYLSQTALGNISSLYFYSAALVLIPYGLMLDRTPTRRPGLSIMAVCVLATLLLSLYPSLLTASIYRIICGLTNSLIFLICMRQAPMWFPKKISFAISMIITIGMLGGLLQYPFSLIMNRFDWHIALRIDAAFGLILLIYSVFFLADKKEAIEQSYALSAKAIFTHLLSVMKVRENWLCGCFTAFLNWPVMVLGATWGNQYLILNQGFSESNASLIVSMIFLGMIPASPFFGWFADKCRSRKQAMSIGAIASILIVIIIVATNVNSIFVFGVLFFLMGFTCTSQIISYTVVNEINKPSNASTAMSLVSMVIYLFGGFGNPIFGGVVSYFLSQHYTNVFASNMGMLVLACGFLLSLLAGLMIRKL